MSLAPAVTVLIPTFNAGHRFATTLAAIQQQRIDRDFEILIIDSGSRDGTLELARSQSEGLRVTEIPNEQFNHGLTRDLGVLQARGEIVVLLAQDAIPADEHWLQLLVDAFNEGSVAGSYSRQISHPDSGPLLRNRLQQWMPEDEKPRVQAVASATEFAALTAEQQVALVRFDNVSAAVRRSVALQIPFGKARFGEDMAWAYRVIRAGYKIFYEPRSTVIHSHAHSTWYEFRRAYLDHQNRARTLGTPTPGGWLQLARRSAGDTLHFMRVVARDRTLGALARMTWWARAVPFAWTQNLGRYLGVRSASRMEGSIFYRGIDRVLGRGV